MNRPAALNALSHEMNAALVDVSSQLEHDVGVRCVVIQGAGEHFMAGGDVKSFSEGPSDPEQRRMLFENGISQTHSIITRLRRMPKPVIASVKGAVAGFGLSLMSACDLVIAADSSFFTLAYCHIGTSPDGGATYALPRTVGVKQAMEIALLGDRFDASRALELGLINQVVPVAELEHATAKLAARLSKGPTAVYGRTKNLINQSLNRTLPEQLQAEQDNFVASALGADFSEGIRAFVEKRKPNFIGH
ncbi:MAG: enoyl-CoA hydratase [Betaproteobacteria bacterium]|nr:enoyl-CoA hydratase [Betaproteobacteria bacterium]